MSYKTRLFLILWVLGFAGVLSFLLVDLSALIRAMPLPADELVDLPSPASLKFVSLIQPTVLVTLAVLLGVWLAERLGLHAPVAEAAARGESWIQQLKPQIIPGVLAGLASGIAIVLAWVVAKPFLTNEFISRAEEFNQILPATVRFLYGGFTEELLLRWGLMTFVVWAAWRVLQKGMGTPKALYVIAAIVVSALAFGIGHLPIASLLNAGRLTLPLTLYVITANSLFGIVAGFLYWRRGLESAMIAHICVHIVLIAAVSMAF